MSDDVNTFAASHLHANQHHMTQLLRHMEKYMFTSLRGRFHLVAIKTIKSTQNNQ